MATICATCRNIFETTPLCGWHNDSDFIRHASMTRLHHATLDNLLRAAAEGCFICNRMAQRKRPSWARLDTKILFKYVRMQDLSNLRLFILTCSWKTMSMIEAKESWESRRVVFYLNRAESKLSHVLPDSTTSSARSWSQVERWMNACDSEHVVCSTGREPWHPTRLLEIVAAESSGLQTVRVRKIPSTSSIAYVALSHCWGGVDTFSLRTGNAAVLETGISCDELPKTFRDAVLFTTRLGIKYIWIDSLCIIQDDAEDWQAEAVLMHKVYRNAAVTLAATAAHNSTEGLFFDRHPDWVRPCAVDVRLEASKHESFIVHDNQMWEDGLDNAPLNRRAWVLQERCLSRRVIHFARQQIFWECRTLVACETFPDGPFQFSSKDRDGYKLPPKIWDHAAVSSLDNVRAWNSALSNYTKAGLTRETDRLIAISGLAKIFAANSGDRYLAGMWEKDLILQLPWHVLTIAKADSFPYIAPSFSWASANAHVAWSAYYRTQPPPTVRNMAKVIEVNLEPATGDLFGALVGGHLKLEALALNVRISQDHTSAHAGYSQYWIIRERDWSDGYNYEFSTFSVYLDKGPQALGTTFSFLLLYWYPTRSKSWHYAGILLQASDVSPGCWCRVGTMTVEHNDLDEVDHDLIYDAKTNLQEFTII